MPMEVRTAYPGDCVCVLAARRGLDPKKVWDLPENEKLREGIQRAPEIVAAGDKVHIPELVEKTFDGATEKVHPFKVKTIPFRLKIKFLDNGEPRRNLDYVLQIDGKKTTGTTDGDGLLDEPLPPHASDVRIRLGDPQTGEDYFVKLGQIAPVERVSGMQQRLHNLGFDPGPIDDLWGPLTRRAVALFQKARGMTPSSSAAQDKPDEATLKELVSAHGC